MTPQDAEGRDGWSLRKQIEHEIFVLDRELASDVAARVAAFEHRIRGWFVATPDPEEDPDRVEWRHVVAVPRVETVDPPQENPDWPGGISDGLVTPCEDCGERPRFDYGVSDEAWRALVPKEISPSVVCLPCLDRRAQEAGYDLAPHLRGVQFTGTGFTTVFRPIVSYRYGTEREPERDEKEVNSDAREGIHRGLVGQPDEETEGGMDIEELTEPLPLESDAAPSPSSGEAREPVCPNCGIPGGRLIRHGYAGPSHTTYDCSTFLRNEIRALREKLAEAEQRAQVAEGELQNLREGTAPLRDARAERERLEGLLRALVDEAEGNLAIINEIEENEAWNLAASDVVLVCARRALSERP